VNTATVPHVSPYVNNRYHVNSRFRRPSAADRECSHCHYALYPTTLACTNEECRRPSGPVSASELLRRFEPPPLFHGRKWGSWVLDSERWCLVYLGEPVLRGEGADEYTAYLGEYEIDLEHVRQSSQMLDYVFQINGKSWATARVSKDLLNALDDVFNPQANLCSGGGNKSISNPASFLRERLVGGVA
jgi:hypothetical protein